MHAAPMAEVELVRCAACGSSRVIPEVRIYDQGEGSNRRLQLAVDGNPLALVFKDRLWGPLTANVCGDCGYVQVHAQNYRELYDRYEQSLNR